MINTILCEFCKHFKLWSCKVFPDGFPPEIMEEDIDHRFPHPDDNGIRFELDMTLDPESQAECERLFGGEIFARQLAAWEDHGIQFSYGELLCVLRYHELPYPDGDY